MNKKEGMTIIVIAVLAVVVSALVANLLLDNSGKINQGNYRISDAMIESNASVTEVQPKDKEIEKLSDLVFDISQTNKITLLIEANIEAAEINLENINVSYPEMVGQLMFYQNKEDKHEVNDQFHSMPIELEKDKDCYKIKLKINNEKIMTGIKVGEDIKSIQYDASLLKLLDVKISQLVFNVSFDLVITDINGQKVRTTMDFVMPSEEILENGMSVLKQDCSKYIFSIEK